MSPSSDIIVKCYCFLRLNETLAGELLVPGLGHSLEFVSVKNRPCEACLPEALKGIFEQILSCRARIVAAGFRKTSAVRLRQERKEKISYVRDCFESKWLRILAGA